MGSTDKIKEKKDKSEKKDKKEKKALTEDAGVKKEKKSDKKEKKEKTEKLAKAVEAHLEKEGSVDPEDVVKTAEELVPFALPLADDKTHKKIYKLIKKGMSANSSSIQPLKRKYHPSSTRQITNRIVQQAPSSSPSTVA